jgi:hypothetical protein
MFGKCGADPRGETTHDFTRATLEAARYMRTPVTRERLKALLTEHGQVAIGTYFALFLLVLAGFAVAIAWGIHVESAAGRMGILGAAYLATKAVQPLRIAATLALTPLVAQFLRSKRGGQSDSRTP